MVYIIILTVLTALFVFRLISCFILREDRSQILMFFVYLVYVLFTVNHRLMTDSAHFNRIFDLMSYFLLTATYILVGEYVRSIYPDKIYKYVSICLYSALFLVMVNQYVLCFFNMNGVFFNIGMCEMSVIYVIVSLSFLLKDFKKLTFDTRLLIAATNFMILCFVMILVFNLLDIKRNVYWFALGILLYVIAAEYVTIKKTAMRLSDLNDIEQRVHSGNATSGKKSAASKSDISSDSVDKSIDIMSSSLQSVFDLMLSDQSITAKDIAIQTNLSLNTVKSYISQIYSRLGVHSRQEFIEAMKKSIID